MVFVLKRQSLIQIPVMLIQRIIEVPLTRASVILLWLFAAIPPVRRAASLVNQAYLTVSLFA